MINSLLQKVFFFFLTIVISLPGLGQMGDEVLYSQEPTFSHQYTFIDTDRYFFIDTSFNSLHWYHQFNHTSSDLFEFSRLGNMGAPLNPIRPQRASGVWNYYDFGAYSPYFKSNQSIPYYYTRSALTEANYWMGYDRGQSFNFYHTQNINKQWNFLLNYTSLNALGDYTHNRNKDFSFLANTHYKNDQTGYEAYAYFVGEKLEIEEFGGIENDSIFEENLGTAKPRVLMGVNLDQDVRIMRNQEVFVRQSLDIAELISTDGTDTTGQNDTIKEQNQFGVGHEFHYTKKSMVYRGNASSGFYQNYFFETGSYSDSSAYSSVANTFFLRSEIGGKSRLGLKAGVKNLVTSYGAESFQFTTNNWGITGNLSGNISDRFEIDASLDYILVGELDQSLNLNGDASLKLLPGFDAYGGYNLQFKYPLFYEQFYFSNNFIWQNRFDREGRTEFFAGLRWGAKNHISVSNQTFTNYLFFNENGVPEQNESAVNIFSAELKQHFALWDLIHQDNRVVYQTTNDENALPLPSWVTRNSLYFEFQLFQGALQCLAGAEVKYFSNYFSPSYNPATGVFYNARDEEIGNYPLVDVFANFKLRKARIFVKYEHANEGLNGYRYYAAPHYPFADRTLRVGITWRFFN